MTLVSMPGNESSEILGSHSPSSAGISPRYDGYMARKPWAVVWSVPPSAPKMTEARCRSNGRSA
jgi:hypothetical protein